MTTPKVHLITAFLILTISITSLPNHSTAQQPTPSSVSWAKTIDSGKENTTTLQFYFHDIWSGKNPSAVTLIPPSNATSSMTGFGSLAMADDQLTVGPEPTSKTVGRAQGLYGSACKEEVGLIMALSYSFTDGVYNGSSIAILGRNSIMEQVREMAVVGGTGVFRMARGYALAHTHWFDLKTGDAIVKRNSHHRIVVVTRDIAAVAELLEALGGLGPPTF